MSRWRWVGGEGGDDRLDGAFQLGQVLVDSGLQDRVGGDASAGVDRRRRTRGLGGVLQAVAMAPGCRAGARLTGRLARAVSRSTLIRLIRAAPDQPRLRRLPMRQF